MKVWRLVSGILSIVFVLVVLFQSCAATMVNVLDSNTADTSAGGGVLLGILMLAAGIVSIATRKGGKGGSIATAILFLLAALIGFANQGTYKDLVIWAVWCLICGVISVIAVFTAKKHVEENEENA